MTSKPTIIQLIDRLEEYLFLDLNELYDVYQNRIKAFKEFINVVKKILQ